jgi:hypothetical protein
MPTENSEKLQPALWRREPFSDPLRLVNTAYRKTSLHRDKPNVSLRFSELVFHGSKARPRCARHQAGSLPSNGVDGWSGALGISLLHDVKKPLPCEQRN